MKSIALMFTAVVLISACQEQATEQSAGIPAEWAVLCAPDDENDKGLKEGQPFRFKPGKDKETYDFDTDIVDHLYSGKWFFKNKKKKHYTFSSEDELPLEWMCETGAGQFGDQENYVHFERKVKLPKSGKKLTILIWPIAIGEEAEEVNRLVFSFEPHDHEEIRPYHGGVAHGTSNR